MSAENLGLGKLITSKQHRDAIHIAVAPVACAVPRLNPGQAVCFDKAGDSTRVRNATKEEAIGIVDPFLKEVVREGQEFWLWLTPGSITSLRHEWTHPCFEDHTGEILDALDGKVRRAEEFLQKHADDIGVSYGKLMEAAETWLRYEDYHTLPYQTPDCVNTDNDQFWESYQIVTGKTVEQSKKSTFFSCAC